MRANPWCVFCRIVAHREPADILYEDDEVIVFRNLLRWVPIMLLALPKEHLTQGELWDTMLGKIGPIAARIGAEHCPSGFRLLSNFGFDAMQSQEHGHVHIIGGTYLGHYA
jgi:histidine triad (HIT) family protein